MPALRRLMLNFGSHYVPPGLFYQRLWYERLREIGFVVTCIEKLDAHHIWRIRLRGTVRAQTHLLVSKPAGKKVLSCEDPMTRQLEHEVRRVASDLAGPIRRDHLEIERTGKCFQIVFIWPFGTPGRLYRTEKKPDAFGFHIRAWVRQNRN